MVNPEKLIIIIQHSCSPGRGPEQVMKSELKNVPENLLFAAVDKGLESLEANPEMGSLDIGVSVLSGPTGERVFLWTHAFIEKAAKMMLERGIKPEPEVYNVGGMIWVNSLIQKGLLPKPYWINFCGRETATPNETRDLLGIPHLKK